MKRTALPCSKSGFLPSQCCIIFCSFSLSQCCFLLPQAEILLLLQRWLIFACLLLGPRGTFVANAEKWWRVYQRELTFSLHTPINAEQCWTSLWYDPTVERK